MLSKVTKFSTNLQSYYLATMCVVKSVIGFSRKIITQAIFQTYPLPYTEKSSLETIEIWSIKQ